MYAETLSVFLSFSLSLFLSFSLSLFLSFSLSLFLPPTLSLSFSSIPSNLFLGLIIDLAPPFPTLQSFPLDTLFCSSFFFPSFFVLICFVGQLFLDVRGRTSLRGGQMWQCQPL